jgi:hypothetical protein
MTAAYCCLPSLLARGWHERTTWLRAGNGEGLRERGSPVTTTR